MSHPEDARTMISLVVSLIIIGVLLWAVDALLPLDPGIRRVIQVVVVLGVCLYLLRAFALI